MLMWKRAVKQDTIFYAVLEEASTCYFIRLLADVFFLVFTLIG